MSEEQKKKFRMPRFYGYSIRQLLFAAVIASFLGFLTETVFQGIRIGRIDDKGQFLPFTFAYGIGILILTLIFDTPKKARFFRFRLLPGEGKKIEVLRQTLYCLILFLFIFFGELGFGNLLEATTGIVLWDYTGLPLTLTKYTSLPTSLAFVAGIYLLMRYLFPVLLRFIDKLPEWTDLVFIVIFGCIIADWAHLLIHMSLYHVRPQYWSLGSGW